MSTARSTGIGAFSFIVMTLLLLSSVSAANPLFDEPSYVFDLDVPFLCETEDLNCDGNMDIIVLGAYENYISVFLGYGDGTFSHSQFLSSFVLRSMSICNLNADAYPDLLVGRGGNHEEIRVYLGNGAGGFEAGQAIMHDHLSLNTGDLNGDGFSDLLLPYNVTSHCWIDVYLCDGNGSFVPDFSYEVEDYFIAHSVSVPGDLNGDGFADVAYVPSVIWRLGIMLGNGDGTLQSEYFCGSSYGNCGDWSTIAEGDFNEDGHIDLAATSGNAQSTEELILVNDGSGNFSTSDSLGNAIAWAIARDFDLDGHLDLAGSFPWIKIYKGWGDGTFGGSIYSNYPTHSQLGVADFDNDGDQDIVRLNDSVYVYLNKTIQQGVGGAENPEGNEPVLSLLESPISSSSVIEIFIPTECDCRISTYDINGRLVGMIYEGLLSAGTNEIQWNNEGLSPGCYFLMLQTPTGSSSTRCVIVE
ncbi:MAG: T9SS type A sorting domain-containing protein [Candidatus Sabulitectum sp.]|nr:T9SS type A sorting domain-containing protein [Candidatus Sabulitectum sp.]